MKRIDRPERVEPKTSASGSFPAAAWSGKDATGERGEAGGCCRRGSLGASKPGISRSEGEVRHDRPPSTLGGATSEVPCRGTPRERG